MFAKTRCLTIHFMIAPNRASAAIPALVLPKSGSRRVRAAGGGSMRVRECGLHPRKKPKSGGGDGQLARV